jgi:hypothetical protein
LDDERRREIASLRARLEVAERMAQALRIAHATLTDARIGTVRYMEGSDIYDDLRRAADSISVAFAEWEALNK